MSVRRRHRGERGASAVEFALILPIFLLLLFGIIDFGYAINRGSMINNAARDAAREASFNLTKAQVETVARTGTASVGDASNVFITVTCRKPPPSPGGVGAACGSYDADRAPGGAAVVTIKYQHKMLTPVGIFFPGGIDLTRTAEMRFE
ncbi:TadE/TadG family type IV pilus assembly protein [Nocardioides solisilvae]|uniref:TadE/TadG family type IV pilus assembly protein n=1 Tax=Nocardioides solisilvae TaxID=1542435 RepID=UPI000D745813|nr:TadE/TadG family type IV pilus assembly protein [Nocardioides solisilvae]